MQRILLSETGGTLTRNFIASLRSSGKKYFIVGVTSHPYELALSTADVSYLVPSAADPSFIPIINHIAKKHSVQLLHSQHDVVIKVLANHKKDLVVKTFFPSADTVNACVNKYESYIRWKKAGIPIARTISIQNPSDLKDAFRKLGKPLWLRLQEGGGGAGSLPTSNEQFARIWINHFEGWGKFTASEMLTPESITWSSIWQNGKLIVAQTRKRLYWLFANRTLSGVTGITGSAVTVRDDYVNALAKKAILTIDKKPTGIFSVDMTYDKQGKPRLTEINIGRFFTTIHFFTEAGLNMPDLFVQLAMGNKLPRLTRKVNPLKPGLMWVRGMDTKPVLTSNTVIDKYKKQLDVLKKNIKIL